MTDAHCHLQDLSNIDTELRSCKEIGITRFVCAGYNLQSSKRAIEIASQHPSVYATVGVHPESIQDLGFKIQDLRNLTNFSKVVAIGECGLDFTLETNNEKRAKQIKLFKQNIQVARETNLPLIIHNRNANHEILDLLGPRRLALGTKVMLHCFTGQLDFMKTCVDNGWYISFGGILTFKKSDYLREIAKQVPENRLLVETDSPYLSPEPHRGKLNTPKNVKIVTELLAFIRNTSINQIEEITDNNCRRLFNI